MSTKRHMIEVDLDVDAGDFESGLEDKLKSVAERIRQELVDKQLADKNPKLTGIKITTSFTADVPDTTSPPSATPLEIKGVRSVKVHTLVISTL